MWRVLEQEEHRLQVACMYRDGTTSKWADRVWAQSGKQNEDYFMLVYALQKSGKKTEDLIMFFSGNKTRTGRRALCFHLLCRLKMFLWWTCVTFTTFWTINEKQLKKNCFPHVVPIVLNPGPRNREACLFWASLWAKKCFHIFKWLTPHFPKK